jgi:hypothetical protein
VLNRSIDFGLEGDIANVPGSLPRESDLAGQKRDKAKEGSVLDFAHFNRFGLRKNPRIGSHHPMVSSGVSS